MTLLPKQRLLIILFNWILAAISLIFIYAASFHRSAIARPAKSFILFNGIHYKNTPDLCRQSVHRLNLVYESRIVKQDPDHPGIPIPETDSIRSLASKFTSQPGIPVTLDIESWSYSPQQLEATISKYLKVISDFKKTNSSSKVGFYGVVPKTVFVWKNIEPTGSPNYVKWQKLNLSLSPIAEKVDIFFPSFYTFDNDINAWKNMVTATLAEIKKYDRNIPVYAYLWPQYHDGTPNQFQFIDQAVWKSELEMLYPLTDGIVIWTSNKDADKNIISWDQNMAWWQTTLAFIKTHNIQ